MKSGGHKYGCTRILLVLPDDSSEDVSGGKDRPLIRRLWQPLDLATTAGLLETHGFHVMIIDNRIAKYPLKKLSGIGRRFDMVFVSSVSYDRWQCPSLDIGSFVRAARVFEPSRLYISGPHVTERAETLLKATGARIAVIGEPEQTVLTLALAVREGRNCTGIPGVAFLDEHGLTLNPMPESRERCGFSKPAFHLLAMNRYRYALMGRPFTIMEGSRGCPFRCRFCYKGMYPKAFRQKNPMDLVNEVMVVRNRHGIRNMYFMDLEFGLNRDFLERFCSGLIRKKANVNWCCQTRVNDIDPPILDLMKKSGCSLIHLGIESGSERILKHLGKQITLEDCRRAVNEVKRCGIRTALFFNAGFPGETEDEREKTLDLALELDPTYASFHMLMPVPGTVLTRDTGYDPESLPSDRYPSFFFNHHDEKQLKKWVRRAYMKFYLRPHVIIRMMTHDNTVNRETIALFIERMKNR